jgi:porphobilinogen deaminase
LPEERQSTVLIDDLWILMKKHAHKDVSEKVMRAVAIASSPLRVHAEIIFVCLQMAPLTEIPRQYRVVSGGILKYD